MTPVVVDSSVALKWFIPEEGADKAATLLDGSFLLLAPDLLVSEVGNALWKKIGRAEITAIEARTVLSALARVPIEIVPASSLVEAALEIAVAHRRTVYDALYVALAVARTCVFVTADERLANALAAGALKDHVRALFA